MAETNGDFLSSMRTLIQSELIDINTSIQGVIVDYDAGFATVKPTGNKRYADGDLIPFPEIRMVPVKWPVFAGGNAGVRGPIQEGDKCLIVFAQQASDGTDDMRRFDISDAYAVMVDGAQQSGGANNSDMIMYFGSAYMKLTSAGVFEVNAPAGTKIIAPTNEFTGAVTVKGLFTFVAGIVGSAASGAAAVINGAINFIGTLTSNGKNISDSHIHSNSGGTGNGGPVA